MRVIVISTVLLVLFLNCNSTENNSYESFGSKFIDKSEFEIEFPDKDFIDSIFKNKQLILLGELDHGDGSSFEVKSRLIKYLHQEYGFNTLVFEASLINCHFFMKNLDSVQNLAKETIYHIWSEVEETQNLFKYIQSQNKSDTPLNVVGIDPQFSGTSEHLLFMDEIKSILPDSVISSDDFQTFQEELNLISHWLVYPEFDDHKISQKDFIQLTDRIESEVLERVEKQDLHFWNSFFENIKVLAEIKWYWDRPDAFTIRDEQMYQNLNMYLQKSPNEKCIVWAANGHIIRNEYKLKGDDIIWKGIKKLGDHINESYGSKAYSIGITSYQGKTAHWFNKDNNFVKIKNPGRNSLENELKGIDSVFVNLKLFEKERNLWNYESQLLYTNVRNTSTWSDNFDGVIFLKNMRPSQKIKTETAK